MKQRDPIPTCAYCRGTGTGKFARSVTNDDGTRTWEMLPCHCTRPPFEPTPQVDWRALAAELAEALDELVDPNTCTCWSPDDRHCKGHLALAHHAEATS